MSSSASYHPHHTSTTSGGVPGAQLGHQQHQQRFNHNMPSTSMPPSSQHHQYNYPEVGPSILQPSGELHSMDASTTASEATVNLAANNDFSQTPPYGMPNGGTGGGETNALQGNIVGETLAPPNATGSTTETAIWITTSPASSSYRCIDRSIDNHDFTSHRPDPCHPSRHAIWNAPTTTTAKSSCFARRPFYCYPHCYYCYYYYALQQLCYNILTFGNILFITRS